MPMGLVPVAIAVAIDVAVGGTAAIRAPPAAGGSPPVGRPFCAIASEVPPTSSAATVALFRMVMVILQNAYAYTHPEVKTRAHRKARCFDPDQYALTRLISLSRVSIAHWFDSPR